MKILPKISMLALMSTISLSALSAHAEQIVKKTTTMNDGTEITVTETTDPNKAADSVIVKKTTYSYDSNRNGFIDPAELTTYITRTTDVDGDGYLESTEYESGSMTYFYNMTKNPEAKESKKYTYWDKDKDNRLDANEMETLVADRGIYKEWDSNVDGKVDTREFAMGTFKAYDDNNDGTISMAEWADVVM